MNKQNEEKFDFQAIREYWGLHVGPKSSQHMQEKVLFKLFVKLNKAKDAERERTVEEERMRIRKWVSTELDPIQRQIAIETDGKVREYLIGQRNKLYDLQIALTPPTTKDNKQ